MDHSLYSNKNIFGVPNMSLYCYNVAVQSSFFAQFHLDVVKGKGEV